MRKLKAAVTACVAMMVTAVLVYAVVALTNGGQSTNWRDGINVNFGDNVYAEVYGSKRVFVNNAQAGFEFFTKGAMLDTESFGDEETSNSLTRDGDYVEYLFIIDVKSGNALGEFTLKNEEAGLDAWAGYALRLQILWLDAAEVDLAAVYGGGSIHNDAYAKPIIDSFGNPFHFINTSGSSASPNNLNEILDFKFDFTNESHIQVENIVFVIILRITLEDMFTAGEISYSMEINLNPAPAQ
jgi:hypothetical protein